MTDKFSLENIQLTCLNLNAKTRIFNLRRPRAGAILEGEGRAAGRVFCFDGVVCFGGVE